MISKLDWTQYNLVRIARIAKGNQSCAALLDKLPKEQVANALNAFRSALEGRIDDDNAMVVSLSQSLHEYPIGSFGYEIFCHYQRWGFSFSDGVTNTFPARYIFLHDAHHVLIGSGADYQGEMEVVAFEGALCGGTAESLMPIITQLWGFSDCPNYDPDFVSICKAWSLGQGVKGDLIETWEIERDLDTPLIALREKYLIPAGWKNV